MKAQKYNHNLVDENGKWKKGASKQLKTSGDYFSDYAYWGSDYYFIFHMQPTEVSVNEDAIEIEVVCMEIRMNWHKWSSLHYTKSSLKSLCVQMDRQ